MRQSVQELMERYQNNLFAAAFNVCKSKEDAEDVVQDTFLQYHMNKKQFENEQHIRAWLFRVAINKAKNCNHTFWRKNKLSLEDYMETLTFETPESENLFETVMKLPEKYRIVIHLFYYEDYAIREIAEILHLSESNVKIRLSRGRALLRQTLKEEWEDDGSVWLYYKDRKLDITDRFEDGICYVKLTDGKDVKYLTIKYNDGYAMSDSKYVSM